jgi:hypothetical protein
MCIDAIRGPAVAPEPGIPTSTVLVKEQPTAVKARRSKGRVMARSPQRPS